MAQEIERKFSVTSDIYKSLASKAIPIKQGYLSSAMERTVRIRIKDDKAYITIKGISNESGTRRYEWEKEIATKDAEELLKLCEPGMIDKVRYEVKSASFTFEVDEFFGDNEGLVVAEIELNNENDEFEKPEWLGIELTGDARYYNSMLLKNPYKNWK